MILVIDNYDSFVYNLARHMELAGWTCRVARNDQLTVPEIEALKPQAIVISPGPCTPREAGICIEAVRRLGHKIPTLGVCLGHQCIGEAYGAKILRAAKPVHGKASLMHHMGDSLFANLNNPFRAGRYHSLVMDAAAALPLQVTARTAEGEIMAVKHETHPVYGVQFHPESILTENGMQLVSNFTTLALAWNSREMLAA
jgi:anthranilate synthase/aminodeoxychorismate synthase-like glutamine amidotransferase